MNRASARWAFRASEPSEIPDRRPTALDRLDGKCPSLARGRVRTTPFRRDFAWCGYAYSCPIIRVFMPDHHRCAGR